MNSPIETISSLWNKIEKSVQKSTIKHDLNMAELNVNYAIEGKIYIAPNSAGARHGVINSTVINFDTESDEGKIIINNAVRELEKLKDMQTAIHDNQPIEP